MDITIRPAKAEDAQQCGGICYQAFKVLADHHRFPPDFPSADFGEHVLSMLISHPAFYGVVAEADGRIVGSNFLDERSTIAGVGPITIDPEVQDRSIGRKLMLDVMDRAAQKGFPGVRLHQATYHNRSLGLYSKLGFEIRELVSNLQGPAFEVEIPGTSVRAATESDVEACNRLCRQVHGHDRSGELQDGIAQGSAKVVERSGRVTGYTNLLGFLGHAVGETNEDLQALIGSGTEFMGPGLLLPSRNGELLRWCMENGLRINQPMTLMSYGLYNEPQGPYLTSVLY